MYIVQQLKRNSLERLFLLLFLLPQGTCERAHPAKSQRPASSGGAAYFQQSPANRADFVPLAVTGRR
jgi:hypothetical protein